MTDIQQFQEVWLWLFPQSEQQRWRPSAAEIVGKKIVNSFTNAELSVNVVLRCYFHYAVQTGLWCVYNINR